MTGLQIVVLAIVQGLTEFLPISSSGHLVVIQHFFDLPGSRVAFDLLLHFGTLIAVVIFFRRDIIHIVRELNQFKAGSQPNQKGCDEHSIRKHARRA